MKRCSACAMENEDGATFCAGCGKDAFTPAVGMAAIPAIEPAAAAGTCT